MTKIPPDDILEGLYKLRIRESVKLKTVLELYVLETREQPRNQLLVRLLPERQMEQRSRDTERKQSDRLPRERATIDVNFQIVDAHRPIIAVRDWAAMGCEDELSKNGARTQAPDVRGSWNRDARTVVVVVFIDSRLTP